MRPQATISVIIDIPGALEAGVLENNIYLVDNMKSYGSTGEGTNQLITAVPGSYWVDGSQASLVVINWMAMGIGSLPVTLPRNFYVRRSLELQESEILDAIENFSTTAEFNNNVITQIHTRLKMLGTTAHLTEQEDGSVRSTLKPLNVFGEAFTEGDDESTLYYPAPEITDIKGEAVDKKVIFPAQYGCPVPIKNGWYWCATVDTNQTGIYEYDMSLLLYRKNGPVWEPVRMAYKARIHVTREPMCNGFTGAGEGFLPIYG